MSDRVGVQFPVGKQVSVVPSDLFRPQLVGCLFFFNDTATTEIYTLSLHDALPISSRPAQRKGCKRRNHRLQNRRPRDRKSTRLNSSHLGISYAVFCLKKKNTN